MSIILRRDKGAPLSAAEIDGNFEYLDGRLSGLESGFAAEGIESIEQMPDGTIRIHGTHGSVFGPFYLPGAGDDAPMEASEVAYSGTVSGLSSSTVQDALDELARGGGGGGAGARWYVQQTAPVAQAIGDLWLHSGGTEPGRTGELYQWDGEFWLLKTSLRAIPNASAIAYDHGGPAMTTVEAALDAHGSRLANLEAAPGGTAPAASAVSYEDTASGLGATNVQEAIGALDVAVDGLQGRVAALESVPGGGAGGATHADAVDYAPLQSEGWTTEPTNAGDALDDLHARVQSLAAVDHPSTQEVADADAATLAAAKVYADGKSGPMLSSAPAAPLGQNAAPGISTDAARADHIHTRPSPSEIGAASAADLAALESRVDALEAAPGGGSGGDGETGGTGGGTTLQRIDRSFSMNLAPANTLLDTFWPNPEPPADTPLLVAVRSGGAPGLALEARREGNGQLSVLAYNASSATISGTLNVSVLWPTSGGGGATDADSIGYAPVDEDGWTTLPSHAGGALDDLHGRLRAVEAMPDTPPLLQTTAVQESVVDLGSVAGFAVLDLSLGTVFRASVAGNVSLSVVGAAASGRASSCLVVLANGGCAAVSWPAGTRWAGGAPPTLTEHGIDLLSLATVDAGATWLGVLAAADLQ